MNSKTFRRLIDVKSQSKNCNVNTVNSRPVVVNNGLNPNLHTGGECICFNSSVDSHIMVPTNIISDTNLTVDVGNCMISGAHRAPANTCTIAPQHGSPPCPVIDHVETTTWVLPASSLAYNGHTPLYKVDRFNHIYVNQYDTSHNQLVYIHNYPQNSPGGFYNLTFSNHTGQITVHECLSHPVGALRVLDTIFLCIYSVSIESDPLVAKRKARLAYENYNQDCLSYQRYGVSYEAHMDHIISSLIDAQSHDIDVSIIGTNMVDIPDKFEGNIFTPRASHKLMKFVASKNDRQTCQYRDINYPTKLKGYIALQPTKFEYIGPSRLGIDTKNSDQYLRLAKMVRESGLPNYRQVRVPIKSGLNIENWRRHLTDYKDQLLIQYLEYGFPLSMSDSESLSDLNITNHFSAKQYQQAVSSYLVKERQFGAIVGPIHKAHSYDIHCSPLLTRPKDLDKRRVILDLSYPRGASLNDQVDRESFDASEFILKLPTVDDVVEQIIKTGDDVTLSKIDIARSFRNLRVDPADAMKLGITWQDDVYIDAAVAFGWVHGSAAFQRVSDAVTFIAAKAGINMVAYIDDYMIISPKTSAQRHFDTLASILTQLGLPSNQDKQTPPCRALTCLGIKIDLDQNTLSIDPDKLASIYAECQKVASRRHLTKRAFQSLLGKLLYLHKCVSPARTFINRMLTLFRNASDKRRIHLNSDFHKDLAWFLAFLPRFNGITYINKPNLPYNHTLHIDASLTGLGGIWNNQVYATPIFDIYGMDLKIVHLEMLNLLIALRLWAQQWSHSRVRFFCDNSAVVQVVRTGKTRDNMLSLCLRNIWLITASHDIDLHIDHIQGRANIVADLLSRLYSPNPVDNTLLQELLKSHIWHSIPIQFFNLNFSI